MLATECGNDCVVPDAAAANILVVEDQFVSEFLRSVLTHRGYQVTCAAIGPARAMLRRDPASVDVLITNTPLEFSASTGTRVLYVAACPDPEAIVQFRRACSLAKPFHPRQLFETLNSLLV